MSILGSILGGIFKAQVALYLLGITCESIRVYYHIQTKKNNHRSLDEFEPHLTSKRRCHMMPDDANRLTSYALVIMLKCRRPPRVYLKR